MSKKEKMKFTKEDLNTKYRNKYVIVPPLETVCMTSDGIKFKVKGFQVHFGRMNVQVEGIDLLQCFHINMIHTILELPEDVLWEETEKNGTKYIFGYSKEETYSFARLSRECSNCSDYEYPHKKLKPSQFGEDLVCHECEFERELEFIGLDENHIDPMTIEDIIYCDLLRDKYKESFDSTIVGDMKINQQLCSDCGGPFTYGLYPSEFGGNLVCIPCEHKRELDYIGITDNDLEPLNLIEDILYENY